MLKELKDGKVVKHTKTGNMYTIIHTEVITATNGNEDQITVIYKRTDGACNGKLFSREINEFKEKFEDNEFAKVEGGFQGYKGLQMRR